MINTGILLRIYHNQNDFMKRRILSLFYSVPFLFKLCSFGTAPFLGYFSSFTSASFTILYPRMNYKMLFRY